MTQLDYAAGVDVTLTFSVANPAANATTALTLPQASRGFVVPAGYRFHPISLTLASNADLTAGTATGRVRANGTAVVGGPEPVLADAVQEATAIARVGQAPIAAGQRVDVAVVTDAAYAPVTADLDAILIGKLLPAYPAG